MERRSPRGVTDTGEQGRPVGFGRRAFLLPGRGTLAGMSPVTTVIIDNHNDSLTQRMWAVYVERVDLVVRQHCISQQCMFHGLLASPPTAGGWQSAAWLFRGEADDALREQLRHLAGTFGQESIVTVTGEGLTWRAAPPPVLHVEVETVGEGSE